MAVVLVAADLEQGPDAGNRRGDDDDTGLDVHPAVKGDCRSGWVVVWRFQDADLGGFDDRGGHGAF